MTRTNLGQHLAWLLNRGPSLYPTLDLSTRPDEGGTTTVVTTTTTTSPPVSVNAESTGTLQKSLAKSDQAHPRNNEPEVIVDDDGDIVIADADMARLEFAPKSATKPRMLTCMNNAPSSTPKTPGTRVSRENASARLDTQQRSSVKGSIKKGSDCPSQQMNWKLTRHIVNRLRTLLAESYDAEDALPSLCITVTAAGLEVVRWSGIH